LPSRWTWLKELPKGRIDMADYVLLTIAFLIAAWLYLRARKRGYW
jgi:uncharacterized membrane protein